MPLIDRAARALAKAEHGSDEWNGLTPEDQEVLRQNALAVISAIRVPSPAMTAAGEKLIGQERRHAIDHGDMHDAWQVMIDVLLQKNVSG
ncbi:hypothetical protein EDF56_101782 [Novosphingobium sp. PhB165]|uniref:hypothetical protein n=1 Tax=Novosphingobium sp. PhB165 TaxID=2485105 RepID=UPI0010473B81|nr:hypothetical protein [Novosphingobium sp. PhB165]TCM22101.1 hypothetical protein EDF56_101782 [Novosphingobium sp. PhB165]